MSHARPHDADPAKPMTSLCPINRDTQGTVPKCYPSPAQRIFNSRPTKSHFCLLNTSLRACASQGKSHEALSIPMEGVRLHGPALYLQTLHACVLCQEGIRRVLGSLLGPLTAPGTQTHEPESFTLHRATN